MTAEDKKKQIKMRNNVKQKIYDRITKDQITTKVRVSKSVNVSRGW